MIFLLVIIAFVTVHSFSSEVLSLHQEYCTWRRQDACKILKLAKRRSCWMVSPDIHTNRFIRDKSGSSSFAIRASKEAQVSKQTNDIDNGLANDKLIEGQDTESNNSEKKAVRKEKRVIRKVRWTEEEDSRLREAVAQYGTDDWSVAAAYVGSRDKVQCRQRWIHSLDPGNKLGLWSDEEDALLKKAVAVCGEGKWTAASKYMNNGKTSIVCRERWRTLEANGNWTPKRDEDLIRLVRQYATKQAEARRQEQGTGEERAMTGKGAWNKVFAGLAKGISRTEHTACRRRIEQLRAERGAELDDLIAFDLLAYSDSKEESKKRQRFTEEDDEMLRNAIAEYGTRDWTKIEARLNGKSIGYCKQRWRLLNKNTNGGRTNWSKDEDADLMKQVLLCKGWAEDSIGIGKGVKSSLPWSKIASAVGDGRKTGRECRQRWRKDLFRTVNPLPWTEEEDQFLLANVQDMGYMSSLILFHLLHGRTEDAIINRWEELTGSKYRSCFTPEEDEKLINAVRSFQKRRQRVSWIKVASQVGSKDAKQCTVRWYNLNRYHPERLADIMEDKDLLFRRRKSSPRAKVSTDKL